MFPLDPIADVGTAKSEDYGLIIHETTCRFPLGLRHRPRWGSSPDSLAVFKGPTSKTREEKGSVEEGKAS